MGLDQLISHIVWVAGGKANAFKPIDIIKGPDQLGQRPAPPRTSPVIRVYILSQKRDFAHPTLDQIAGLGQDTIGRAADFCATGIRHNAKCAEFIAPLLHGQKRAWRPLGLWASFEMFKFVFFRKISIKRFLASANFCLKRWQTVVTLRPNHQIYHRLAAHDLCTFGLCDTASNANLQIWILRF